MSAKLKGLDVKAVVKFVNNRMAGRVDVDWEGAGLIFSAGTHKRQKRTVEERRTGSGSKLGVFEALVSRLASARVEEATPGVIAPPVEPSLLTAALQVKCPRDTGALSDSLEAVWNEDANRYDVYSHGVPYGRIQDLGGYAGKNHAAHLAGHFYLAKAAAAVGIDSDLVQWAEVPDA